MIPAPTAAGNGSVAPAHYNPEDIRKTCELVIPESGACAVLVKNTHRGVSGVIKAQTGFFDRSGVNELLRVAQEFSGQAEAIFISLNPVDTKSVPIRLNRLDRGGDGFAKELVPSIRTLFIDIDTNRPDNLSAAEDEKEQSRELAIAVRAHLRDSGFPTPVFADSGNGFHLLYRVELQRQQESLLRDVLKTLSRQFDSHSCRIDTKVFNVNRLTKLYGTKACKGNNLPNRPHRLSRLLEVPDEWEIVPDQILRAVAGSSQDEGDDPMEHVGMDLVDQREALTRAISYIKKVPGAVSGNGGQNQALFAACKVGPGFGLTQEQTIQVLRDHWNNRCQPAWSDAELVRKVSDAFEVEPRRGFMLMDSSDVKVRSALELPALDGPVFPIPIRDFVLTDQEISLPQLSPNQIHPGRGRRRRFSDSISWLFLSQMRAQCRVPVVIPDQLFKACIWGDKKPPRDWKKQLNSYLEDTYERQELLRLRANLDETLEALNRRRGSIYLQDKYQEMKQRIAAANKSRCGSNCPYSGRKEPHKHYLLYDDGSIGRLSEFAERSGDHEWTLDFSKRNEEGKPVRKVLKRELYEAYLPIELFGPSPHVNIPRRQRRLLQGIVREVSRIPSRNGRWRSGQDERALIEGGKVLPATGKGLIVCPFLDPAERFVNFGSNLYQHARRGYRIIGQDRSAWLSRAGYPITSETTQEEIWEWVTLMLKDLNLLTSNFNLTVAGLVNTQWRSLDEMVQMVRTAQGRRWLDACRLRVFGPEDYLAVWRRWFAQKLGFGFIPGGELSMPTALSNPAERPGPERIRVWLRQQEMTQKALAQALEISEGMVSRHLSGDKAWGQAVQDRLEAIMGACS